MCRGRMSYRSPTQFCPTSAIPMYFLCFRESALRLERSGQFTWPEEFADVYETEQLSLMGITVVVSSGDFGVEFQASGDPECLVNGTLTVQAPNSTQQGGFVGAFPASCPYVTAVGSTQVSPGKSVCSSIASFYATV